MKVATVAGPSKIKVLESPGPTPGSGDILVRMHSCGICGSDLEKVYGKYGQPSMRLGHEPAGVVVAVGSDVKKFKAGDRVFTHHHVPCYSCYLCRHGNETRCEKYYKSNLNPCGLAQEYVVPAWNVGRGGVLKLPDSVSFDKAAMIEPLACCIRAWSKCQYQKGDSVAIFGAGSTGMMHAMLAMNYEFSGIYCIDVNEFRLKFAQKMGISEGFVAANDTPNLLRKRTGGRGVDLAVVSTSSMAALKSAISSVRYGGTVMMFGVPAKDQTITINMDNMYSREIHLQSSYAASDLDTAQALKMIRDNQMDVGRLITHKYDIGESQEAFDHAKSGRDAVKIIVNGTKA